MEKLNINIVTALICLAALAPIIRGIFSRFTADDVFNSFFSTINFIMLNISFVLTFIIAVQLFSTPWSQQYVKELLNMVQYNIVFTAAICLTSFLLITAFIYSILRLIGYTAVKPVRGVSAFIQKSVGTRSRFIRAIIGMAVQVPAAAIKVITIVFLIGLLNNYYPFSYFARAAGSSRVYNMVNSYAVKPIVNSNAVREIPEYLNKSIDGITQKVEVSEGVNAQNGLQYLGYIRFQFESKSNAEIDKKAKSIVGNETDERKKAYLIYKWIGSNIDYDWSKYNNIINGVNNVDKYGAIPAFTTRKGVCEDYSDLYVAMARAVGLKVRIVVGKGYTGSEWGGHAWNEVYINNEKKWIPLDTTWAKAGNYFDNKNFYKEHISEGIAGEW